MGAESGCELTVQTLDLEAPPPAHGANARAAPVRPRPHSRPSRGPAWAPPSTAQRRGPAALPAPVSAPGL